MEKKKIDKVIEAFRRHLNLKEEGPTMSTGSSVGKSGFSSSANSVGPTAGFDPLLSFQRRKGPQIKLPPGSRKRWMKEK